MITLNKYLKTTIIWFFINAVIAVLIFSFIVFTSKVPALQLFLSVYIITNIISVLCASTGYLIGITLKKKSMMIELPITLAGSVCAALIGILLSRFVVKLLFGFFVFESKTEFFIPSLIIALVVTTIAMIIERLRLEKTRLSKDLDEIRLTLGGNSKIESLSIREDDQYRIVRCEDIIYLSSHGKKTTLHTHDRDYETNQLIKNIENKLPDNFIRIHKQFIINLKYLSQVKYYEGGRYMAYLNDEDESALPIGKNMTSVLKEKIGIN